MVGEQTSLKSAWFAEYERHVFSNIESIQLVQTILLCEAMILF